VDLFKLQSFKDIIHDASTRKIWNLPSIAEERSMLEIADRKKLEFSSTNLALSSLENSPRTRSHRLKIDFKRGR